MKKLLFLMLLIISLGCFSIKSHSQCGGGITLSVQNPSFEGTPGTPHVTPPLWDICQPGTTPDTQPGCWGITLPPSNGISYIGMCNQTSGNWHEGAGQTLSSPMVAGTAYNFTIDLATSNSTGGGLSPGCIELQVWGNMGGIGGCAETFLCWSSGNVTSLTWQTYTISFTATQNWTNLLFMSNNLGCSDCPYIMMDNMSQIVPVVDVSQFTWNNVCFGNAIQFTDQSTSSQGTINSWDWDFGDGSPHVTNQNPTYLYSAQGNYNVTLTITSTVPCTTTVTNAVTIYSLPVVGVTPANASICMGSGVSCTASGASVYQWAPASGLSSTTGATVIASPVINTTYTVTGTDANGCSATDDMVLTVYANPTATTSSNSPLCAGQTLNLTSGGGTSYSWSGPNSFTSSTQNPSIAGATPAASGTYIVTISDANGCSGTDDITITVNPTPSANAGTDQIICNGQSVNLTAYGGVSYLWSNSIAIQSINVSPAITTTYIVTVTDANGCTASDDVQVIVNPLPPADAGADQTICYTNIATLNASGGTSYQWSPITNLSDPDIASPVANPLATTTYTVTVTDANGCSDTDEMTLTVLPTLLLSASTNPASLCFGGSAVLTAAPSGGNGNYTYTWDNGIGISTQSVTVTPTQTTMYHVTLTDDCGTPQAIDSVEVIVYPLPVVQFVPDTISGCQSLTVNFSDNTTPAIAIWDWNFGDPASGGNNNSAQQNPTHIYNDAGTYTVSLVVTTTNGCGGSDTLHNLIDVYLMPDADFSMLPTTITMEDPTIYFYDQSSNAYTWVWDFGDYVSGQNNTSILQNPVHTYSDSGSYTIFLMVHTDHGCMDTISKDIYVKEMFTFYVPNAFTPNDDGFNDFFFPQGVNVDPNNFDMYIFDRWGNLMFHTNTWISTYGEPWNGTKNNRGTINDLVMDVYIYRILAKEIEGTNHEYIGRVTLIP